MSRYSGWPICCAPGCDHESHLYADGNADADRARFVTPAWRAYCNCCADVAAHEGVEAFICDEVSR